MAGMAKVSGMAGWLKSAINKIGAAIASAIGTALAGPIGGAIALKAYDATVGDNLGDWVLGAGDRGLGLNGPKMSQQKQEKLLKWLQERVQPWFNSYLDKNLHKIQDNDRYKRKVNDMLLNLEALRLMYKAQAESNSRQKNLGDISIEDFQDIKAKSELFKLLTEIVRESFIAEMKRREVKVFTKQINGFDPSRYDVNGPETITYTGEARTSVKLFVFDRLERLNIEYNDGEEVNEDDDAQEARSGLNNNKGLKAAGTFIGVLAGGYLLNRYLKK